MDRILLYYPSTNIPDSNWIRSALLYTDRVSSILPYDFQDDHVTDLTKLLTDEGVYYPIFVTQVLATYHHEFAAFEASFIASIESDAFQKIRTNEVDFYSGGTNAYEMFKTKFSDKILKFLASRQLLEDRPWGEVAVERKTAAIYLGMLADYVACISDKNLVIPSTDDEEFERLIFQIADKKVLSYKIHLVNCLPTPSPQATIKEIVKFKKKRTQELLQFREVLDDAEMKLNGIEDFRERKAEMVRFKERIQKQLLEISRLMGDSKLNFVLNGLSSLLDFKQKEVVGTLSASGMVGAGVLESLPLAGLGAGALLLTGTLISSFRKIRREVQANSVSYIYFAQRDGILKR